MNTLVGLALCFGVTYFLSASKATESFRATDKGKRLNNPILVGAGIGSLLSLLSVNPTPQFFILSAIAGVLIGWGVQAIKDPN